ncbi:ribonuclease H-like domain-containing protein [Tanacetum coccineum]
MAIGGPSGSTVLINNLDVGNPLHAKNKYGFVDNTCLRESYATSDVLTAQWDRCNAMVLTWIMNSVSQDVYIGLVYFENVAHVWKDLQETYDKLDGVLGKPVGSALLTRDPLLDVKDAYNTIKIGHTIERCFELIGFPPSFKRSSNYVKQGFSANIDVKHNEKQTSGNSSPGFTFEHMKKILSIINETPSANIHANMAVYVLTPLPKLKIIVGHPTGRGVIGARQTREPFPLSDHKSKTVGGLVYLDLWGPNRVPSREGFKYFLTIVDEFSTAVWVYLVKTKDDVFDVFVSFIDLAHKEFYVKIKTVMSDNGT